jgi:hypothetical protein
VTTYDMMSLRMPIHFNTYGDNDSNRLLFALTKNLLILKYIWALIRVD